MDWTAFAATTAASTLLHDPLDDGSAGPLRPRRMATSTGQEAVPASRCVDNLLYWITNLFKKTKHGATLAEALKVLAKMKLEPQFLQGNHDNYLGNTDVGTHAHAGSRSTRSP